MRDPGREEKAAHNFRAWLHRAALAAIPMAGLAGCGSDCNRPDFVQRVQVDGGVPWAVGSQHSPSECAPYCGTGRKDTCFTTEISGCAVFSASAVDCQNHYTFCYPGQCGRLPAGLAESGSNRPPQPSMIAATLAAAARLEGAAVFAFQSLERELRAHRAPTRLVERARAAQRDEERHHAAISGLAARFGARVAAVEVNPVEVRRLLEVATENAVEGCVRETWGAAVAAFQGECAGDRTVRRAMRSIAIDEAEHASLGWAVDGWARGKLTRAERARVEGAREDAYSRLLEQSKQPVPLHICTALGLPDVAASARLMTALAPLWP